ncbi:MAG: aldo/keto reductase [Bacteroidia bacterium]|nr:aldo/keto reductase [Bacteroidia bacterium]
MKLALGTVQFGLNYGIANTQGAVAANEAKAILNHAKNSGMDTLDTAIAYGDSEYRLGQVGIQGWKVVTKLPSIPEECVDIAKWVALVVNESLQRLNVTSLYGLLLHRPGQLHEKEGDSLYRALEKLKYDGLVQKIGISIYDPSELDTLCSHFPFDLVQAPFNLLDRRLIESGWLFKFEEKGIELHVRSVFLQGLLLMNSDVRPKKFDKWLPLWDQFENWLNQSGLKRLQACLCYALSFPEISKVIVGVDSLSQLNEILTAARGSALQVPDRFRTDDPNLLNPARWATLTD